MEGLNSGRVLLVWKFTLDSSENLQKITIGRRRPDGNQVTTIATRPDANSSLSVDGKFRVFYNTKSPATLVLKNVRRTDDYVYCLEIFYSDGIGNGRTKTDVRVRVFGEYETTSLILVTHAVEMAVFKSSEIKLGTYFCISSYSYYINCRVSLEIIKCSCYVS